MSFVRPEVQEKLSRWREALLGAALLGVGVTVFLGSGRVRFVFGAILIVLGALFVLWGIQRARFYTNGAGAGVVEIDERQISYYGPEIGGALALENLARLAVVRPHAWELTDLAGQRLTIPVDAAGADALFEIFVALPGFSASRLAAAAQSPPDARKIIWSLPDATAG